MSLTDPDAEPAVAVLVIDDGRPYLMQAISSLSHALAGTRTPMELWMYDDTGDAGHRAALAETYRAWRQINGGPRQGFGGAIRAAWTHLLESSTAQWVFHVEADFTFRARVDLAAMIDVMEDHPYLAQMALCRQPWSEPERAVGGVLELNPDAYTAAQDPAGRHWLEHRLFFTTNPSLYRRELCTAGWPDGAHSEGRFTHHLLREGALGVPGEQVAFGYWGRRGQHVLVDHIGHARAGVGY